TAAVKAYSSPAQRAMAFSLYYALMNVAYAAAGWTFDAIRGALGEYGRAEILGFGISTYRTLLLAAFCFTLPGLLLVRFLLRDGVRVRDDGVVEIAPRPAPAASALLAVARTARAMAMTFAAVWRQRTFYRF